MSDRIPPRKPAHVSPLKAQVRPVPQGRVQNAADYSRAVTTEVRALLAAIGGAGWGLFDIAAALDCSPRSLYSWRKGAAEMPASKLLALRDLVAREVRRAA